jgi:hypothetical protein
MFGGRNKEPGCPLMGGKPCMRDGCTFWIKLRGTHPQTGAPVDEHDCSFRWMPVLMIEGTQQTRQAGAAIESFRNEMARQNGQLFTDLAKVDPRLIGGAQGNDMDRNASPIGRRGDPPVGW